MPLQPLGIKPVLILFVLLAIGPVLAGLLLRGQAGPLHDGVLWSVTGVCALSFAALTLSFQRRSAVIEDGVLSVRSTFYSLEVRLAEVTRIRTVLPGSVMDGIGWRVNGVGLPGYGSGWFTWKDGGRVFVDRCAGAYLLFEVDGQPRLALQFADNQAALQQVSAARTQ
jgi:hypothetical protein